MCKFENWGIWHSFNSASDVVMAALSFILVIIVVFLFYKVIRPTCVCCGKSFFSSNGFVVVESGSGPETCESAFKCIKCYEESK